MIAAFAAVYLIWGSTYLGIRFAIETMPPHLMAAARFLVAGAILYAWSRWRGAPRPTKRNWGAATVVGGLLLLGGNGAVVWAETRVPSGLTALLVAMVPIWMAVLEVLPRHGGRAPRAPVVAGLVLGVAGLGLLIAPGKLAGRVDPVGAGVLLLGSFCWAFGSLVGFTAYIWLLSATTPARVSTYAYVNPVVAVLLGWAFAREPITLRTLLAAAVIVGAVALIIRYGARREAGPTRKVVSEPPAVISPRRAEAG